MTVSAKTLRAIAWLECRALVPSTAVDQIEQLAAVVTRIAIAKDGVGFNPASTVPARAGEARDRSDLVSATADKTTQGTFNGNALPTVAALWEVNANKLLDESTIAVPADLAWVKDPTVVVLAEFKPSPDSTLVPTRRFRLFMPIDFGASLPTAFTSGLTTTGLPARVAVRPSRVNLSRAIAVASALAFIWSAGCLNWSGKQFVQGIQLLQHKLATQDGELALRYNASWRPIWGKDVVAPPDYCIPGMALTAAPPAEGTGKSTTRELKTAEKIDCLQWWTVAMQVAHGGKEPSDAVLKFPTNSVDAEKAVEYARGRRKQADELEKGASCLANAPPSADAVGAAKACGVAATGSTLQAQVLAAQTKAEQARTDATKAWDAAWPPLANDRSLESMVFGAFAPDGNGSAASAATMSLITPLVLMMASVFAFVIAAGLGVTGLARGVFISSQNRISLARCQVVAWSILVLPTIVAFACFNAGVMGQIDGAGRAFTMFPTVPFAIYAALGISITSTMLSPLLLSSKDSATPALQLVKGANTPVNDDVAAFSDPPSKLSSNSDPSQSSFSDLFLGEETGNDTQVDISRLQLMIITVGLIATYADMIFALVGTISMAGLARAVTATSAQSLLASLPEAGPTFTAMLAISHVAYLITKGTSTTPTLGAAPGK